MTEEKEQPKEDSEVYNIYEFLQELRLPGWMWFIVLLFLIGVLASCSPRALTEVNKQAPDPPYAGQYHGGLDRARYLKVEGPLYEAE